MSISGSVDVSRIPKHCCPRNCCCRQLDSCETENKLFVEFKAEAIEQGFSDRAANIVAEQKVAQSKHSNAPCDDPEKCFICVVQKLLNEGISPNFVYGVARGRLEAKRFA